MNTPKPSDVFIAPRKYAAQNTNLSDAELENIVQTTNDAEERELAQKRLAARHLASPTSKLI